jgi:hypothetical protein
MATGNWSSGAVSETIGSGQDRANIAAFEGAHDGESPTDGTLCQGRLVGADAGTGLQYWAGWQSGMNATTRIVITADAANQPDGVNDASGNKALIQGAWFFSDGSGPDYYIDLIGVEWDLPSTNAFNLANLTGGQARIAKCVFRDGPDSAIKVDSPMTVYIGGSLFKDVATTGGYDAGIYCGDSGAAVEVVNCTVTGANAVSGYGGGINATGSGVSISVKNCALVNNDTDLNTRNGGVINETTNKSEDDGEITSSNADDFTAPSSDDYTVYDTDSALYHAGTQISESWFTTLCSDDLAGTSWNNTPSVGCFEYTTGGSTTIDCTGAGAVAITGLAATISAGTTIACTTGAIAITGAAATVSAGTTISCTTGAIAITGAAATVSAGTTVAATTGTIAITGLQATIGAGTTIDCSTGAVAIASNAATISAGTTVAATTGAIAITGLQASIVAGSGISCTTGAIGITGLAATVSAGTTIAASTGAIAIAGLQAEVDVSGGTTVDCSTGQIAITGLQTTISAGKIIDTTTGAIAITGNQAAIWQGTTIDCTGAGALAIAGYGADVIAAVVVECSTGAVVITGNQAQVVSAETAVGRVTASSSGAKPGTTITGAKPRITITT